MTNGAMTPLTQANSLFLEPEEGELLRSSFPSRMDSGKGSPQGGAGPLRLMVPDTCSFTSLTTGPEGY